MKKKKDNNPSSVNPSEKPTVKKDHTKSANLILSSIILFTIIITVLVYFQILVNPYTYHSQILDQLFNVTKDHKVTNLHMDSIATFTTTSLSAQNPINVNVKLLVRAEELDKASSVWNDMDPILYAVFPESLDHNQTLFSNTDVYQTGVVALTKTPNPDKYEGNGQIIYQFEGKYGYFYVTAEELRSHGHGKFTTLNDTEFGNRIDPNHLFSVGSSDFTTTIKTNNIVNSLTLVLVIFALFELRKDIRRYLIVVITRFRG